MLGGDGVVVGMVVSVVSMSRYVQFLNCRRVLVVNRCEDNRYYLALMIVSISAQFSVPIFNVFRY